MTKPDDIQGNERLVPKPKRCGIYARYSSDMQRESSIEDQVRKCSEYAAKQGWIVVQNYIRSDQAASGTSLTGRDGIISLVAAAEERPCPFDVLLIDNSSRLARNLINGLTILRRLMFLGVNVVSVSQGYQFGR
jgi:DNA invertase Pin-like site-specific DNA recombinase